MNDIDKYPPEQRDTLTNLPNLLAIQKNLNAAVDQSPGQFALLEMDVDGFKDVNDTLGHKIGDHVLRTIGHTLSNNLREDDQYFSARRSGDEFSIIIHDVRAEKQVRAVRERIRSLLAEAISGVSSEDLGISIGGRMHKRGESVEELRAAADFLMYEDKIARRIERYDNQKARDAIRKMSALALEYGISPRDFPLLYRLMQEGRY